PRIPTGIASDEDVDSKPAEESGVQISQAAVSLRSSLKNYALAGLAAVLLLGFVEWIDLNIQLTPVFESFAERLTFTAYFGFDLLVGGVIGLVVGLTAYIAGFIKNRLELAFTSGREVSLPHRVVAGLLVSAVAGALLYLQPGVY